MIEDLPCSIVMGFPLGPIIPSPGVTQKIPESEVLLAIQRHALQDWGDVCAEERHANDEALEESNRLLSVYHSSEGEEFWVITEWNRSATTVLLPEEY
jgi:hypothetical protein